LRYRLLDIVRGLAALWVFAFHYPRWEELRADQPFLWNLMQQGHLGVPLFFVVSGYCMMASARSATQRDESTGGYMKRRLVRIYPPFWCSILVVMALPWIMALVSQLKSGSFERPQLDYAHLGPRGWLQHLSLGQIFAPGFERIVDKFSALNSVYWTLAIEVQFYLVMGLGLLRRPWLMPLLGVTTLLGVACALRPELYLQGVFLPYWPMFAMGIALYLAFERGWEPRASRGSILCGLAVFAAGLTAIGLDLFEFHQHAFAALSTLGLFFLRPIDRWLEKPLRGAQALLRGGLVQVGNMSYSLYLLHAELMILTLMFLRQGLSQSSLAGLAATITVTTLLTYPFYRFCEKPFILGAPRRAAA
jgi:peptidoglycan/LPS O-acetylase OafA/YrhL